MVSKRKERIKVTPSSGTVFADMGLPEPEEELTRAQLATLIERTIKRRRLTRAKAAALMAVGQPKVSALLNGRLGGFSSDRLMRRGRTPVFTCLERLAQSLAKSCAILSLPTE